VKSKVLVLNGAADPFIKPDSVEAFKKEMDAAKVDYRYISYPGACTPSPTRKATDKGKQFSLPLAYNAEADMQVEGRGGEILQQRVQIANCGRRGQCTRSCTFDFCSRQQKAASALFLLQNVSPRRPRPP
jgi:hypothetical protein